MFSGNPRATASNELLIESVVRVKKVERIEANNLATRVLFACVIIRSFQLVFSVGTMFFSHNKLAGTVFRLVFLAKRTGPSRHKRRQPR